MNVARENNALVRPLWAMEVSYASKARVSLLAGLPIVMKWGWLGGEVDGPWFAADDTAARATARDYVTCGGPAREHLARGKPYLA